MPKAQKPSSARKSSVRPSPARPRPVAATRSMKRGTTRTAPVRSARPTTRKRDDIAVTRVTHETEVRGTETRVERVVERAPKPTLPDVDRAAGRGRYVYCIIRASQPLKFGAIGMDDQWPEVYTINFKDMAAIVSDIPLVPLDSTRENVLAHERVNETVMRDHTVIPMSFGTIFKTREDIVELLRSAYEAFKDVLVKMEDKLEFGLKILWDRDLIVKELETENEDIRRLKSEITSQKGSTYFARMQYGRLVDAALQSRSERYVHEIFEALRPVSVASRANRPIGDRMIMNAAFLVRRDREAHFDAIVKEIGARH